MKKLIFIIMLLIPSVSFAQESVPRGLQTKLDNFICKMLTDTQNNIVYWDRSYDSFSVRVADKISYKATLTVRQDRAELEISAMGGPPYTKLVHSDTYVSKSKCVATLYNLLADARIYYLDKFFQDQEIKQ